MRTAAALVIGNELLSGKIREANIAFLAKELFALGIKLRRVIICPDDADVIASDLNALRGEHDLVFTSGGIGPTHDDITIASVAKAFGRTVVRDEAMASMIVEHRRRQGKETTDAHLRMADIVEGSRLVRNDEMRWPTVVVENVYVLPGVPEVFRLKFEALKVELAGDSAFATVAVYTRCDEGEIAVQLEELEAAFPGVQIGSYPVWNTEEYRTKITFDASDAPTAERAANAFVETLTAEQFVRRS